MITLSDDDLNTICASRVKAKLYAHRRAPERTLVAVRLNLNCRVSKHGVTYAIQTVHRGGSPHGRVLGYDHTVTVREAAFYVNQPSRASIAAGHAKFAMAAVVGKLVYGAHSFEGIAVRFNPKETEHFVRVDDGRAVTTAEEVTIFNTRAYARGAIRYVAEGAYGTV